MATKRRASKKVRKGEASSSSQAQETTSPIDMDVDIDETGTDLPLYSDDEQDFIVEPRVEAPLPGRGRGRPPRPAALQRVARDRAQIQRESARKGEIPEGHKNLPETSLLKGLSGHLSAFTRSNLESRITAAGFKGSWSQAYDFASLASVDLKDQLFRIGFLAFASIPPIRRCDRCLIIALTERWFGATNTFHFPCCELTITPTDFVMLTGISFGGEPIPPAEPISAERIGQLLGIPVDSIPWDRKSELSSAKLGELLAQSELSSITRASPSFLPVFRRLFLYMLGQCFFLSDRSSIDPSFLLLMDHVEGISKYDWGAAIYAHMLSEMRRVSSKKGVSFRFFFPLIELWAHEYLEICHPKIIEGDEVVFPISCRWGLPTQRAQGHSLGRSRMEIDWLTMRRVTLQPYRNLQPVVSDRPDVSAATVLSDRRTLFGGRGTYEYYLGERVSHQYTGVLRIPRAPTLDPAVEMPPSPSLIEYSGIVQGGGAPVDGLLEDGDYESWLSTVSIGRIMDDYVYRTSALEIGGEVGHLYELRGKRIVELETRVRELELEVSSLRVSQGSTSGEPPTVDADIQVPGCSPMLSPTQPDVGA